MLIYVRNKILVTIGLQKYKPGTKAIACVPVPSRGARRKLTRRRSNLNISRLFIFQQGFRIRVLISADADPDQLIISMRILALGKLLLAK